MYQLAQLNIARMLKPLDHPIMADFVNNLDRINAIAESSSAACGAQPTTSSSRPITQAAIPWPRNPSPTTPTRGARPESVSLILFFSRFSGQPAKPRMLHGARQCVQPFGVPSKSRQLLEYALRRGQTRIDATHIRKGVVGQDAAARFALAGARFELVSIKRRPAPPPPPEEIDTTD